MSSCFKHHCWCVPYIHTCKMLCHDCLYFCWNNYSPVDIIHSSLLVGENAANRILAHYTMYPIYPALHPYPIPSSFIVGLRLPTPYPPSLSSNPSFQTLLIEYTPMIKVIIIIHLIFIHVLHYDIPFASLIFPLFPTFCHPLKKQISPHTHFMTNLQRDKPKESKVQSSFHYFSYSLYYSSDWMCVTISTI